VALDRFRKHMRVPLPMVVEVKFEGEKDSHPLLLVDISWGGMYIRSENLKPIGSRLTAHLPMTEYNVSLDVRGHVVTHNKSINGRIVPGMGVSFDELDHDAKSLIQKLINKMLQSKV
jgi:c-di-GMP-binding flagellar brake protein YcgR